MASFEYNSFTEYIIVKYKCPKCKHENTTEHLVVPTPDWTAESHHNSVESDVYDVMCENCGDEREITLATGIYGGEGEMDDDIDIIDVEEFSPHSYEDDSDFEQFLYDETHNEIEKTLDEIVILKDDVKQFIYRLLYANVITSLESFLSDTLKREVLKNDDSIRKFTENYVPFSSVTLTLNELHSKKDQLSAIIEKELREIMYHNLGKLKPIYRQTLGIDLGEIKTLCKAVLIRHDLVHRNGKDFDGKEHNITENDVRLLLTEVKQFIHNVEEQLNEMREKEMNTGVEVSDI